jgi:diguanylate cyclase (GGDEF)-like protein
MDNSKTKILIADDESSIRDALKAILLSENYNVIIAKNGKEAIELFKRDSPDLVILDVCMPHMNGFEALEQLKKLLGERYLPILFLTVSNEIDAKLKALYGGAMDYLTKPVSPEELLARVKNFLEIKEKHDKLKEAAVYDWMTGAMNKGHFLKEAGDELEKALRNKTPISFIFMDIDHFKKINDEIGHLAGDFVITEFGCRLKKNIRKIDLLGRFGGDEFMIMLPNKGKKDALAVARRIEESIRKKKISFEKKNVTITTSQGIVSLETADKIALEDLVKLADEALYEAKAKGGDCHVVKAIQQV